MDASDIQDEPVRTSIEAGGERFTRLRWVFTRHLCFGGLVGALVFFCLSLTPSLVPRLWAFQATVSGSELSRYSSWASPSEQSCWCRRSDRSSRAMPSRPTPAFALLRSFGVSAVAAE